MTYDLFNKSLLPLDGGRIKVGVIARPFSPHPNPLPQGERGGEF